ncbi:type II toxin-antitoxin system RelE/ParE family toxin [Tunicatimonas pelagia]|uniref:type II toxin-antitoxin system RelE/ParE family toxin n=1 Tax=Tunicatimonas pelagia TaxID=931531 RepID=UPI002665C4A1|nr:type II toxin-antitoxin system RelE/ParE family toxin [Tunicatimonas pelagia]WKN41885.1 type II toxin-antitoxin system RelE/ParE family toxin [Tunicatimonas pelagia]
MKEYIAYQGTRYVIEWFYSDKGKSQALEYYQSLAPADRRKVLRLFQMMGEIGQIRDQTKFRNEGDKVYAFKPQPHRFLSFFFEGQKIIVTNAFIKKQQKLPKTEKERALRLMADYQHRVQEDNYYEQEDE